MLPFAWFKKKEKYDEYDEFDEYDDDLEDYEEEEDDDEFDYEEEIEEEEEEEEEDTSKYDFEAIAGNFEKENLRLYKENERLKRKFAMAEEEIKMMTLEKDQMKEKISDLSKGNDLANQSTKKQLKDTISLYTKVNEENKVLKEQLDNLNTYGFDIIETEKKLAKFHVIESENEELKTQLMNVKVDLADAVLNAKDMAKKIVSQASEEASQYQLGIEQKRNEVIGEINEIYHELDHSRLKLNDLFNGVRVQVDQLKTIAEEKKN